MVWGSFRCLSCRFKEIGLELFAQIILNQNTLNSFFLVTSVLYFTQKKEKNIFVRKQVICLGFEGWGFVCF